MTGIPPTDVVARVEVALGGQTDRSGGCSPAAQAEQTI
jgi:hypothetical protein